MFGVCSRCGPVEVRKKVAKNTIRGFIYECWEKRRAESREREKTRPKRTQKTLSARTKGLVCERCGFVPEDLCQLELDHVVPRWRGGSNARENRQTLCANCHALKTRDDLEDWRKYREQQLGPE